MTTQSQELAVSANGIVKQYVNGTFTALHDVAMEVHEGEVVAFIGPSGCGKTTMLRLISGLELPTQGSLETFGTPISKPGPDRGMIFQAYTSFPWLTAKKNIEYGMKIMGVPKDDREKTAQDFLKLVHLEKFAHSYPASLSGGMKQRVAIARTLAQNPRIILMDEPFGALDAQVRWEMQEMMVEVIEREKKTVLVVTHDIEEAIYMADRIIFFTRNPGRIKESIPMEFKKGKRFKQKEEMFDQDGYAQMERKLFAMMREEIVAAAAA
ncbi:ABC transporter ATP-binding protein [Defluviimonas aestuarii]|uniref:ABC transporter ATP-binding protein n=1 Tax=Albidovulum aestuarii TaxID=1130726 RepID=UPI00249C8A87|nr:ABC transporter ATP-binding protein [Defluviimonas aestuarii]MDI3335082.1 ABC transporter ATP-binding protein [Defluviimonas aestuarii]